MRTSKIIYVDMLKSRPLLRVVAYCSEIKAPFYASVSARSDPKLLRQFLHCDYETNFEQQLISTYVHAFFGESLKFNGDKLVRRRRENFAGKHPNYSAMYALFRVKV